MNAVSAEKFDWKKVLQTPVSQLMRGKVTGPQEPLELLDTSAFSDRLVEALRAVTDPLSGRLRVKSVRRLVQSCSSLLREGCAESQLIEQLSEPASIATLIRATRNTDWIFNAPLPARLWPVVERIVVNPRIKWWSARRMLRRVCQNLRWQLDAGHALDEIILQCGDGVALSGLAYETEAVGELLDYPLPESLMSVVLDVVQRSRLWPDEKREVALELCTHFADGLEKGESEAVLLESFGSPQTAAKLIRRARLRNRPLAWRARRRTWQGLGILLFFILVPWLILAVRFLAAEPTIKFDVLQEYDRQSRTIPRQERAWPLYLQGLEYLKENREFETYRELDLTKGTASAHWSEAKAFLKQHPRELDFFLKAAQQPELGFIYRPLTNDLGKFRELNRPYEDNTADRQQTNLSIGLPHLQDLSYYVAPFLRGASFLTAEQGDSEKCFQLFLARLAVAEHISQVIACPVTYMVLNAKTTLIAQDLERLVKEEPEFFTDDQLTTLFRKLKMMQEKSLDPGQVEWLFISDFLQKAYTDDGKGNGRFTANGFRILCDLANYSEQKQDLLKSLFLVDSHSQNRSILSSQDPQYKILAAPVVAMIADRKTMRDKFHELFQLLWSEQSTGGSAQNQAESRYLEAYQSLRDSAPDRIRYLPVLLLMPDKASNLVFLQQVNHAVQQDIALTLIAAELYRREQGQLPETLEDLVPGYFAAVPVDPGTGKPLRYQVRDGQPVVEAESLLVEEPK
ncbi:DUF1700 domain-containing protein [Gimesia panareensis]|uniref:hypothetical protein n=1 Tax=Gimesia panareensis TaxID=2527978 RepID=UPI00118AB2D2|nr:hypothetical protein [Gimesia panareensis]QDU47727.1 hypothetical protein Pan110_00370 [Gimesia panareensis]